MRYLISAAGACLLLGLVLLFLTEESGGADTPVPVARDLSTSAVTGHRRICKSYLDTINGDHTAWISWTSSGDEVTVRINAGYFQLSSEVIGNVNEALRCAAAPNADDIDVVKYEDQGTKQRLLEWKQATGFRALQ